MIAPTQMAQGMPEGALGRGPFAAAGDPTRVAELEPQSAAIDRHRARSITQGGGETLDHQSRAVLHLDATPQQQRLDRLAARRLLTGEHAARRGARLRTMVDPLPLHPGAEQARGLRVAPARLVRREGCPLRRAIEAPSMELGVDRAARDLQLTTSGLAIATQSFRLDHHGAPMTAAMQRDQAIERAGRCCGRGLGVGSTPRCRLQRGIGRGRSPGRRPRLAHLRLLRRRLAAPELVRLGAPQQRHHRTGARALDHPPAEPRRARDRETTPLRRRRSTPPGSRGTPRTARARGKPRSRGRRRPDRRARPASDRAPTVERARGRPDDRHRVRSTRRPGTTVAAAVSRDRATSPRWSSRPRNARSRSRPAAHRSRRARLPSRPQVAGRS